MNRTITTFAAAAIATAFALSPAAAQNLPPPGNVNPGSMNSGAEQTGAPNQPRSPGAGYYGYGPMTGAYYGPGYDAYAYGPAGGPYAASSYAAPAPGMSFGPFGFAPGYGAYGYGTGGAAAIGADN